MSFLVLSYVSDAVMKFRGSDLDDLRHTCRVNNAEIDVTGMLIYAKNMFLHVLEGESTVIIDLFGKIENDSRHKNVVIIDKAYHADRIFDTWSMGYPRPNREISLDGQEGYVELFESHRLVIDTQSMKSASVAILLNAFKKIVNTKEASGPGE